MIYTVTFNPAIDYIMYAGDVLPGKTNRSLSERVYFGGKGINVSIILKRLGIDTAALGFIAGFTGDALQKDLKEKGIKTDFLRLDDGLTRINVKLKGEVETEINACGPNISTKDINRLFEKLEYLKSGDVLVLAGSVPASINNDIYEKIMQRLSFKGIRFAVDTSGELLRNVLKYKPFVIKPNTCELEELCGSPLKNDEDIIFAAKQLKEAGAVNVLVSMGKNGALLIDEAGNVYRSEAVGKRAVNTVGAGDSMLAGFLAGIGKGYDYAFKLSLAAGGATAGTEDLATKEQIEELMN